MEPLGPELPGSLAVNDQHMKGFMLEAITSSLETDVSISFTYLFGNGIQS